MILPTDEDNLARTVIYLCERCLSTREQRNRVYDWRERYYLFGTTGYEPSRYNRLESHIDLVTSFLYAPDHAFYHIAADRNAKDEEIQKAISLQDDFNDDFQSSGISDAIMDAIPWSLVYDTMIGKLGWNRDRGNLFCEIIPPHNFGVYRERITDLESQSAFTHTYFMEYQQACARLMFAGHEDWIPRLKVVYQDSISPMPEMLNRMIIAGTGGSNLAGTVFGQVNPDYTQSATYQAQSEVPVVRFTELWVWDDSYTDWRVFNILEPDLVFGDSVKWNESRMKATRNAEELFGRLDKMGKSPSKSNPFFPDIQPFFKIQAYRKHDYFWGKAHIDALIPLQEWMLERLDQIADILEKQANPPRVGSGFLGLSEEKMAAFGGADSYIFEQLPNAKVEELAPNMPPDIFAEFREITQMFLEASGLTDVMAGRSEQGVRSRQHASELKKTGSGRIKKAALALESALVKCGEVGLKLKMAHDDKPLRWGPDEKGESHPFLACDVTDVTMSIDGHSHSPLFGDESRELAFAFRKVDAIDNEQLIRMTNPPGRDSLLHSLQKRERQKKQLAERLRAENPEAAQKLIAGGGGR